MWKYYVTGFSLSSQSVSSPMFITSQSESKNYLPSLCCSKERSNGKELSVCNEPQPEDIQGHLQCRVNEKDYD